jgi:hypothetical protein
MRKNNKKLYAFILLKSLSNLYKGYCHGRDRMVVGFTTTCEINAYHH